MSENLSNNSMEHNGVTNIINTNGNKRHTTQIEHLENPQNSFVSVNNGPLNYETKTSNVQDITLGNVMVSHSRTGQMNGNIVTLHHESVGSTSETYGNLEYVSSPVMNLQEDHQNKFNEGLVPVNMNNVDFVELNEGSIKSSSGPPLELYFDVPVNIAATSSGTTQVSQALSYLPRHEHQTPKAQLLVRAYSDYIQPLEQQHMSSNQNGHLVESSEHNENFMTEVLEANLVPMSLELDDMRKSIKYDQPKRQIHPSQHKSGSNFHINGIDVDNHSQSSSNIINDQHSDHVKHHGYISTQQMPLKFQHTHKQYNHQNRQYEISGTSVFNKEEIVNQVITSTSTHNATNLSLMKPHEETQTNDISPNVSLVSRSGRPIRRRPEYQEYVDQNIKEELANARLMNRNYETVQVIKNEINEYEEPEIGLMDDMTFQEHEVDLDNSNDEDQDPSENYTSDGKKFLPHKKRIPKKLKNSKKHVKCYKCSECGEQFVNQSIFNQHKQTHVTAPKPKLFNCALCNKGFELQIKFFEHLKSHYEPNKKHKCEVCGGEFDSADLLQEHSLVHSRVHYKCNICHKTFRKESMLEIHTKTAHLEDESSSNNLIDNPYPCTACSKIFKTQLALDYHVQSDHDENPPEFNCEDCYQVFKSKAKLLSHRKSDHKEEVPSTRGAPKKKVKAAKASKDGFPCGLCLRTFAHKNSLTYHIRGHTGERPHQCEQCGKAFYAASALKVHLRLHSGEKPYKCEVCEKFFRQWGDLKYHTTSVHSETRQFQCEFCGKDFKRKYCLVVHRRIHTGEKKYKCEYCQKCFRASSYLQNHIRIHTGERPYPCPDCSKPFRVRSDMKRHRHTHVRDGTSTGNSSATANSRGTSTSSNQRISTVANVVHVTSTACNNAQPTVTAVSSVAGSSRQLRTMNHTQGQVQILQGSVTSNPIGQLIITDSSVIGEQNQPIRIMVSGLPQQQSLSHGNQPPPAHKHSQVSTVSISGTTSLSPGSPNMVTSSNGGAPTEVIIMEDSHNQPINLNILPRILSSSGNSSNHTTIVSGNQEVRSAIPTYELIQTGGRNDLEIREGEDVCVWGGLQVFSD